MKRRLVILTEIISPYRIPLFNGLAQVPSVDLHVIFLAETDPNLRQWRVYKEEIRFSHQVLPSWRKRWDKYSILLNRGVGRALTAASPQAILCGGYSYMASWQALFWARSRTVPFLLWSESNLQDRRRGYAPVEFLKAEFLRRCDGFVVPGRSAGDYLRVHKIREDLIFTAPNAVDNALFANAAATVRQNAFANRKELGLPKRYYLFVGRLVKEKGVFELLAAYARLGEQVRQEVGLVFVGDGPCRSQLEVRAGSISPGVIRFVGFAQREQLGAYYSLADMLILPTHSEPWGLVVNEAMACGLPIVLSGVAGCAADLVKENWNGLLVPPRNESALAIAMESLTSQPDVCAMMGANSVQHISNYSAKEWCLGIARAVGATTRGAHD